MKPKQTIEVLEQAKEIIIEYHKEHPRANTKSLGIKTLQAIDHAINCVGAIEQIKWERDIAISQLNELGYELGEKIREEDKRVKIISETIDGVKTGLIIPKADKE